MRDDLYCKLYVNYSDAEELTNIVANILDSTPDDMLVEHEMLEAEIIKNKSASLDSSYRSDPGSAFLFYPHYIEIESTSAAQEKPYIELIGSLITALREQCGEVVAACDYEDLLPK